MGRAAALVACLVARLLAAGEAGAWGVEVTHETIYDRGLLLADQDDEFSRFLREQLGFRHGRAEGLAVQIGFDLVLDQEIGPFCDPVVAGCSSRLLASQNRAIDKLAPSPQIVRIFVNLRCPPTSGPAFDECFADLKRFSVARLIRLGVWAEDNPNPRARHHFHDPVFPRPPPPDSHGLNDQIRYLNGVDVFLADTVASFLRGGDPLRWFRSFTEDPDPDPDPDLSNFELRGRSAVDRALNRPLSGSFPSTRSPENLFALPDTERYLYRGLTAPREDEREHYLALHFIAFGHVSHLLQDSSSPGHVRNDFVIEHVLASPQGFETIGADPEVVARALSTIGEGNLFQNLPITAMSLAGESDPRWLSDLSGFDFDPRARDFSGLWDEGALDNPDGGGLAEITNRYVVTAGSAANTNNPPVNGYPNPVIPDCGTLGSAGSGELEVWTADLPMRDLQSGAVLDTTKRSRYVSNPLFPHLARCRLHAILSPFTTMRDWEVATDDESVQRDYLDNLWRLAVNFQTKLIQKYYRPRIQVVPQNEGVFQLANRTGQPFTASADAVEIVYEDVDGNRHVVPVSCSAAIELEPAPDDEEPGPPGVGLCFMPSEGSLPATPAVRDDFWVVVRGQLGERGSTNVDRGNPDGWKTEDFVVAFERVRPQILYNRTLADVPSQLDTDLQKVDVMRVSIEPLVGITDETDASGLRVDPGFEPVNLTDPFRQDAGDPELDFTAPQSAPMGGRMAIRSDWDSEPEEAVSFTDIRAPLDVFVFDPTLAPADPDALVAVPDSRIDRSRPLFEEYRINWTLDELAIFFATEGFAGPHNRHEFSTGTTTLFADGFARAANFEPNVDVDALDVGTILAACSGAREIAPRTATEVAVSSECSRSEVVVAPTGNNSLRSLDQSPEIMLMTIIPNADDPGKLDGAYTHRIDVDAGQVVSCGASQDCWDTSGFNAEVSPVWSPDGTKLALLRLQAEEAAIFVDDAGFELWVADLTTNRVKPLVVLDPESENLIFSPSWSPGGDWIVFGKSGDTLNANELYAVPVDTSEVQTPRQMTRGARVGATVSWEKTLLLLPAQ